MNKDYQIKEFIGESKIPSITKWERLKDKVAKTEELLKEAIAEGRY